MVTCVVCSRVVCSRATAPCRHLPAMRPHFSRLSKMKGVRGRRQVWGAGGGEELRCGAVS